MKKTFFQSDKRGKFFFYFSNQGKQTFFSVEKNSSEKKNLKEFFHSNQYFPWNFYTNLSNRKTSIPFLQKKSSINFSSILLKNKKIKLKIIKGRIGFSFDSKFKIETCFSLKSFFFFYSNNKIFIVDLISGEYIKKICLKKGDFKNFSKNLILSSTERYLIVQNDSITILDWRKGNVLKKITLPSKRIEFLNIWKKNCIFLSYDQINIQSTDFKKKKTKQILKIQTFSVLVFKVQLKQLRGYNSMVLTISLGKTSFFLLLKFERKLRFRFPFSLSTNKKITFCFLRPQRNLVVVFLSKREVIPIKIKLERKNKIVFKKGKWNSKKIYDRKNFKKIPENQMKIKSLFVFPFISIGKKEKNPFWGKEIFFKTRALKKLTIKRILNNSFWLVKSLIRFKSFLKSFENLQFFQKKNILRNLHQLTFEWIEPLVFLIIKKNFKKKNLEKNILVWLKEVFFHFFFSILENKNVEKIVKKIPTRNKRFLNEEIFLDFYINLRLCANQSKV